MNETRRAASTLIGALALLAALAWHATGAAEWERPVIALVTAHQLPLSRLVILAFEPLPFALITAALAGIAARSGRVQLAATGALGARWRWRQPNTY